jgi:PhoPQ-activated pathogenicity-related protein
MEATKLYMSAKLGLCHLRCPEMKVFILDYLSKTEATPLQRAYTDNKERAQNNSKMYRNKRNSPTVLHSVIH